MNGGPADSVPVGNDPVTPSNGAETLGCGTNNSAGRNAVFVFSLPPLPAGQSMKVARLDIVAKRNFAKWWEADL